MIGIFSPYKKQWALDKSGTWRVMTETLFSFQHNINYAELISFFCHHFYEINEGIEGALAQRAGPCTVLVFSRCFIHQIEDPTMKRWVMMPTGLSVAAKRFLQVFRIWIREYLFIETDEGLLFKEEKAYALLAYMECLTIFLKKRETVAAWQPSQEPLFGVVRTAIEKFRCSGDRKMYKREEKED